MRWVEIAGPPGVGKSTLVDKLWPPRCIAWNEKPYPKEWSEFLNVTDRLVKKIIREKVDCIRLNYCAFQKIAEVSRIRDNRIYIQTGFVQRGLGIGFRLENIEDVAAYFEIMPVSVGVALLFADVETVKRRNVKRRNNLSYMVVPMERSRQIAAEVLRGRGVPLIELDMTRPVDENRKTLLAFSDCAAQAAGSGAAGYCG